MSRTMTDKSDAKHVEILNPRYAGATPEMLGYALLRPAGKDRKSEAETEPRPINGQERFQSSI